MTDWSKFRAVLSATAAIWLVAGADAVCAADEVSWRAYADCAAAYRANWKDRLSDPTRTAEMRDSILAQSEDYETAAARLYRMQTGVDSGKAKAAVHDYVEVNLPRFVSLDKRDALNSFLDKCPQPNDAETP